MLNHIRLFLHTHNCFCVYWPFVDNFFFQIFKKIAIVSFERLARDNLRNKENNKQEERGGCHRKNEISNWHGSYQLINFFKYFKKNNKNLISKTLSLKLRHSENIAIKFITFLIKFIKPLRIFYLKVIFNFS